MQECARKGVKAASYSPGNTVIRPEAAEIRKTDLPTVCVAGKLKINSPGGQSKNGGGIMCEQNRGGVVRPVAQRAVQVFVAASGLIDAGDLECGAGQLEQHGTVPQDRERNVGRKSPAGVVMVTEDRVDRHPGCDRLEEPANKPCGPFPSRASRAEITSRD